MPETLQDALWGISRAVLEARDALEERDGEVPTGFESRLNAITDLARKAREQLDKGGGEAAARAEVARSLAAMSEAVAGAHGALRAKDEETYHRVADGVEAINVAVTDALDAYTRLKGAAR